MRMSSSIFFAALLGLGCATVNEGVPLPATTPFQRSSVEEAEYLQFFRSGYEAGRRGMLSTYCLFGADFDKPVLVARSRGWTDGQEAGLLAWSEQVEQAIAAKDRSRLLILLESARDDASAVVDDLLSGTR